ncbi:MAG: HlyD family secretion protein [Burkholderiales bacterium]|nr:HlyD family secretion protein [Burkholderiales bacterium]
MNTRLISRIAITSLIFLAAILLGRLLWVRYMDSPWTRDGRVRADVVDIAPDVAGLVEEVAVRDNQPVKKGDLLFRIDPEHYLDRVAEARAQLAARRAELELKQREAKRRVLADDRVVSQEERENAGLLASGAGAAYLAAKAKLEEAKLDLSRTEVRSPVDGWVSNLLVRPGDFAHVGAAELAVIDRNSFWVYGYFEENKVALLKAGDPARIRLLGSGKTLSGHVESIAHGISDRDNPTDPRLLANVNPSFNWVRLAQRIPVRIRLDATPRDVNLVAGMTCTVTVSPKAAPEH